MPREAVGPWFVGCTPHETHLMTRLDYEVNTSPDPDRDAVASLHDIDFEAGDEAELTDMFVLDELEARDLGVALDRVDGVEPALY